MRTIAQAVLLIVGMSGVAHADAGDDRTQAPERPRALAITAALVPGAVVHGSGHYALGDRKTAWRLLKIEGLGLGLMGVGGATLGLSGSDENVAALYVPLLVGGATLFAGSFLADLLGVALPAPRAGVNRAATGPDELRAGAVASTAFGYRFVSHPNLTVTHLGRAAASVRAGPVRIAAAGEADTAGAYRALEVVSAYQLPWRPFATSALEVGADAAHRRLPNADFASTPLALWVEATWLLDRYVPRLPGAYARGRLGAGVEVVDYATVVGRVDDAEPFLVAFAGLGLRLGRLDLEVSYDHRHDGLPGGGYYGRLPGMVGSVGVSGRLHLSPSWAVTGETRYGTGLSSWFAAEKSF